MILLEGLQSFIRKDHKTSGTAQWWRGVDLRFLDLAVSQKLRIMQCSYFLHRVL